MFDSKWLEYQKLPLWFMLAVALSAAVLLGLVRAGVLHLVDIGPWATPLVIIILVVSSVFVGVKTVVLVLEWWRQRQLQAALEAKIKARPKHSNTEDDLRRVLQQLKRKKGPPPDRGAS
ncbi:MAG: hypothetical protein ACREH4_03395 [Vitreimonas sp.]